MIDREWEPPGLRDLVAGIRFMPGWMVYLGRDNEDGEWLCLHIVSCTPNSYEPDQTIRVNHSFLVPMATWNERTWKAWIMERYVDVWRHETGEFLTFEGVREFAPHHGNGEDPYITWHVGDLADTRVRAGDAKV
jgi:hypothetical protein